MIYEGALGMRLVVRKKYKLIEEEYITVIQYWHVHSK